MNQTGEEVTFEWFITDLTTSAGISFTGVKDTRKDGRRRGIKNEPDESESNHQLHQSAG